MIAPAPDPRLLFERWQAARAALMEAELHLNRMRSEESAAHHAHCEAVKAEREAWAELAAVSGRKSAKGELP